MKRFPLTRVLLVSAVAVQLLLASAASALTFAPGSVWHRPLANDAPIDPRSSALVRDLLGQLQRTGPWMNTNRYSTPVYRVNARTPLVRVRVAHHGPARVVLAPVPRGVVPAAGTDGHAVIWRPSTDTMWEFWQLRREGGRWHASAAGRLNRVSRSGGVLRSPTGATASGLAVAAGMVTPSELRRGRIDHALAIGIPEPRRAVFTPPANRTDGHSTRSTALPLGTRLRLPASLDLDRLGLPAPVLAMARAAQRYGIVVRDTSGAITFYAQDVRGADPYRALLGGVSPDVLLREFPWRHLQVLRMSVRCCWHD